jgi:hydroxyacylglutathione hydrolase
VHFEQFYLACLSHASYLLGSEGEAAVVDPQRDVAVYLEEAGKHNLRIRYIIETHLHRDFVSGHRELAEMTGAQIYVSRAAGAKFPHVAIRDGDELQFGRCRLKFLETPGHSLDSISILVADLDRSEQPFAVLTGDTLFIGDVGRPDLARSHSAQELAALLYRSLFGKLLALPDEVLVYPAHGAGSLCGRQLGSARFSTIGAERTGNYALQARSEEDFVRLVTSDLPERPAYFESDAEINRTGAPPLSALPPLKALQPGEVRSAQRDGVVVLDTRPVAQFAAGHIPGSIHIGLEGQYASWAGILLGLEQPLVIVGEDRQRVEESRVRLARVGIEKVAGYVEDGFAAWARDRLPVAQVNQVAVQELGRLLQEDGDNLEVVDVRRPSEWQQGIIPRARLMPLDKLPSMLEDLDRNRTITAYCKSGYRSSIATSLMERAGFTDVVNVTGGMDAWRICGLPVACG